MTDSSDSIDRIHGREFLCLTSSYASMLMMMAIFFVSPSRVHHQPSDSCVPLEIPIDETKSTSPSMYGRLRAYFKPNLHGKSRQAVWVFHRSDCWKEWFRVDGGSRSTLPTSFSYWTEMKRLLLEKASRMSQKYTSRFSIGTALEPIGSIGPGGISCGRHPSNVSHHRTTSISQKSVVDSSRSLAEQSLSIAIVHQPDIDRNGSNILKKVRSELPNLPIYMFQDSMPFDRAILNDQHLITLRKSSEMTEGSQWTLLSRNMRQNRSEFVMFMTPDQQDISFHQVEAMVALMKEHREIDVVVALLCKEETLCQPSVKFEAYRGGLESVPIVQTGTGFRNPYGDNCFRTDMAGNVFILRTDLLDTFEWDESLDQFHQIDFFLQLKQAQRVVVACKDFTAYSSNEILLPMMMQYYDMDLIEYSPYKLTSAPSIDSSAQRFLCKWNIEHFTDPEGLTWKLDDHSGHLVKDAPRQVSLTTGSPAKELERHGASIDILYNSLRAGWYKSMVLDVKHVKIQPLGGCLFQRHVQVIRKLLRQGWDDSRPWRGLTTQRTLDVNYTNCDYAARYLSILQDYPVSYDDPIFFITAIKDSIGFLIRLATQLRRFLDQGKSVG
jgi:hypothetical protein